MPPTALEITNPTARKAAVATSVDEVAAAVAHVSTQRGEQGALANRVDQLLERKADTGLQLAAERSGLEDTDIQAVIARLGAQQLSLQAAQAVFAQGQPEHPLRHPALTGQPRRKIAVEGSLTIKSVSRCR